MNEKMTEIERQEMEMEAAATIAEMDADLRRRGTSSNEQEDDDSMNDELSDSAIDLDPLLSMNES